MIELKNLVKKYKVGHKKPDVVALKGITLTLPDTGMVFVLGKSGSGKSTFLNVVGGLDSFEGGDLILFGKSAKQFTDEDYNSYRNKYVGFIFQEYNIIDNLSVRRNVELALELQNKVPVKEEIDNILARVGLLELADRMPSQLSGGQKQRIAIARAIVKHPQIILADEPTGALDSFNTEEIFKLLREISQERLVVCVTHDAACAEKYADRIIRINQGVVAADITRRSEDGVAVNPDGTIRSMATGLIKIEDPQGLKDADLQSIKDATKGATGPAWYAYGDHVRIPADLAQGDDSMDNPVGFSDTSADDIEKNSQKKRSFKRIKSHMRSKTMLRFGVDMMKHSPGRLAMTVILSLLSFVLLGAATILSSYNAAASFADSAKIYRPDASVLQKTYLNEEDGSANIATSLTADDVDNIRKSYPQAIAVYRAVSGNISGSQTETSGYENADYYSSLFNSVAPLSAENQLDSYGFTLEGEYPETGEVVLTDYAVWVLEHSGFKSASGSFTTQPGTALEPSQLIGQSIYVTAADNDKDGISDLSLKISGILHTDITEEQIDTDIPAVEPGVTDASSLIYENFTNGPSRVLFVSQDQIASEEFYSAMNLGRNLTINRALIPTADASELQSAYEFSLRRFPVDSLDSAEEGYTMKRYTIDSSVVSEWVENESINSTLSSIQNAAIFMAVFLAIIAILVTMNFLFTSVNTKIRQIGILKGLGASSHEIFGIFVIEAMTIAAINFVFSCLFSWLLGNWANGFMQTMFAVPLQMVSFNWLTALVLFAISFLVSLLSALIPCYRVASMKPADAMKRSIG